MKVLLVELGRQTQPTGICRVAANMAIALSKALPSGSIHLALGPWQVDYFREALGIGAVDVAIETVDTGSGSFARNRWTMTGLPAMAALVGADVVHLGYPMPVSARRMGRPVVATVHDLYPFSNPSHFGFPAVYFNQAILKACVKEAEALVCVSEATRRELLEYLPLAGRRDVTVVPNTVSLQGLEARRPDTPLPERYLLAVGQHRANKRHDRTIRAAEALGLPLVLVGAAGPESEAIRTLAGPGVTFLEGIADEELRWLYAHALALVVASETEGFCLPVVEALACGTRVVCTDLPVLHEIASDAATFFPCSADPADIATALGTALDGPSPDASRIIRRFSPKAAAESLLSTYERRLKARVTPPAR